MPASGPYRSAARKTKRRALNPIAETVAAMDANPGPASPNAQIKQTIPESLAEAVRDDKSHYGNGLKPSALTFHLPSLGKPGVGPFEPSQPPAIIATAASSEPFDGK